ncbi:MAG TPA: hypothetical protein VFZ21_05470 [Gemmatimonadaceae bacterium]|nr:hypothetical protein [Gemmatimonadaceae bacterium]
MQVSIRLASRAAWRLLVALTALIALGHVAVLILGFGFGFHELWGLRRLLNLNEESNIPTFYSSLLLVAATLMLTVLAATAWRPGGASRQDARYWAGLALLFAYMSIDEAAAIHELLNYPIGQALNASGVLYFAWVVPYALLALVVAALYTRFLWRLPRPISTRIALAGVIFVSGAIGVELFQGANADMIRTSTTSSLDVELSFLVEETMEMLGVSYLITTLLRYVEMSGGPLYVTVRIPDTTETQRATFVPPARASYRTAGRYAASGSSTATNP